MADKICPLMSKYIWDNHPRSSYNGIREVDCRGVRCAWYDSTHERCAILQIALMMR